MDLLKERVLQYLPSKPFCSNDKTASLIRQASTALLYPTIQLNAPHLCAWLVFDVDEVFKGFTSEYKFSGTYVWEDVGLPCPNLATINPENGHPHLVYAISPVFTTENARIHPLEYLAAIERTYTRLLNADSGYVGLMTHNPLHEKWQTIVFHNHEYTLSELQNNMKLDPKKKAEAIGGYSRHIDLFDALRYHAYARVVNSNIEYDALYNELLDLAEKTNTEHFNAPLPMSSLRAVSKSVSRYCIRNRATIYAGYKPKERKLKLDESQPLSTRQAIGAHYAATVKVEGTLEKLKHSYNTLLETGKKATQKAVQEHSKVSLRTVKTYWVQVKN